MGWREDRFVCISRLEVQRRECVEWEWKERFRVTPEEGEETEVENWRERVHR